MSSKVQSISYILFKVYETYTIVFFTIIFILMNHIQRYREDIHIHITSTNQVIYFLRELIGG
jgi:hypothetical protein